MHDVMFSNNNATGRLTDIEYPARAAGLYIKGPTRLAKVSNCEFVENRAVSDGAGLVVDSVLRVEINDTLLLYNTEMGWPVTDMLTSLAQDGYWQQATLQGGGM